MMMPTGGSLFAGLAGLVVVVALIAVVAGAALGDTDLFNYNTSAAAARAQDQVTQTQAQKDEIDIKSYEAIQNARTETELEKIRLELEDRQRESELSLLLQQDRAEQELAEQHERFEQDLALAKLTHSVALAVGSLIALVVSVGLAIFLIQFGRRRVISAQANHVDQWLDPAWRAEQIRRARATEIAERGAKLASQASLKSVIGGDGRGPAEEAHSEARK